MLGTLVNAVLVLIAGIVGAQLKKGMPKRISETVLHGMALCVMFIGISGALAGENILIAIISLGVGALLGELINIEKYVNKLGDFLQSKVKKKDDGTSVGEGFVACTLLFCVGAMAITGAIESGLSMGSNQATLLAKSTIDFISSIVFGATLGIGAAFSAISVFLYQGIIELVAIFIGSFLPSVVVAEMTAVGSVLILALGLNMIGATKFKVANMLPAIFLPLLLCFFF
jgi:uncharacterized membrane protein YqgA involved in biofilm formation